MAKQAKAGWYPDPKGSEQERYWDGGYWTHKVRDRTQAESIQVNPIGLILAGVGAALMVVAVFLPRVESQTFFRVADNTLIASGDGWIFIGLAVGIALAAYATMRKQRRDVAVLVMGLIAIGVAVYDGTGNRVELTSLNSGGGFGIGHEKASPGAGIYAAGAGGGIAAVGGLLLAGIGVGAARDVPDRRVRKCPDCAETVLADAKVCKHCGYRFDAPPGSTTSD